MKMKSERVLRSILLICIGAALGLTGAERLDAAGLFEPPSLQSTPADVSAAYDVQYDLITTSLIEVTGGINRTFGVGFSAGGSGNYNDRRLSGPGGNTLNYQLVDSAANGRVVKDLDGAPDGSGLLSGTTNYSVIPVNFDLVSAQGQLVPPGTYTDLVTISLYAGTTGQDGLIEQVPMPISVNVVPVVSLSVVDTGGTFDPDANTAHLDFGALVQGAARAIDLLVKTNVNYTVSMDSMHAGVMAMLPPGDGSTVPYVLEVDGTARDLSSGTTPISTGTGPTSIAGDRYDLYFEIGEIGHATSGAYEDHLTVIVTAQ